jgi:hypothetical protein
LRPKTFPQRAFEWNDGQMLPIIMEPNFEGEVIDWQPGDERARLGDDSQSMESVKP